MSETQISDMTEQDGSYAGDTLGHGQDVASLMNSQNEASEAASAADALATTAAEAYPSQDYDDETYELNHPEDGPQSHVETSQASPRAFYRSDYGRAARLIQAARHVPGDPFTAKPQVQLDAVSALAVTLATTFALDSPQGFDSGKFFTSTLLPVKPQVSEPEDDWNGTPEESDPDGDEPGSAQDDPAFF